MRIMSRYEFVSLICFCEKYIFILLDLLLGLIACPTYEYVQVWGQLRWPAPPPTYADS